MPKREPTTAFLLFACLGSLSLADYPHSDRSFPSGGADFLNLSTTPRRWIRRNGLTTRRSKA